jgi:Rieske Fe-S protein
MSFARSWRENETRSLRGLGALLVGGLMALSVVVVSAIFLWPRDPDIVPPHIVNGGQIGDLELRSPKLVQEEGLPVIWLVRLDEPQVIALIGVDTARGCTVPWRPSTVFDGETGWFRDPCTGSVYDLEGNCYFGPCPRGLDRYPVEMRGDRINIQAADTQVVKGRNGKVVVPVRP